MSLRGWVGSSGFRDQNGAGTGSHGERSAQKLDGVASPETEPRPNGNGRTLPNAEATVVEGSANRS